MRLSIHSAKLDTIIRWVADDDPRLLEMPLEADGRFQTREASAAQLAEEVIQALAYAFCEMAEQDFPRLVYGAGRARGGSTSLTNVFGVAGFPAYYQPLKSILRQTLTGDERGTWAVGGIERVFAKETFGPYSLAECLFLPVDVLLRAGYPKDKIHVVLLDREPMSALASWLDRWGHRLSEDVLIAHFLVASHNSRRVAGRARAAGVRVTHYVHELCKEPELSIARLFGCVGESERFTADCVNRWDGLGDMASGRSGVIFPREPDVFHVPGLHGSDSAYRYRPRALAREVQVHRRLIADYGVNAMYQASVDQCIEDLALEPAIAYRVFGDRLAH